MQTFGRKRTTVGITVNLTNDREVEIKADHYKPLDEIVKSVLVLYPDTTSMVLTITYK